MLPHFGPPPFVLGRDFSGVVTATGPGVVGFEPGDDVFGCAPSGAHAEYVVAPAGFLARKPVGLDHAHAAALPLAGLTAWQSLVQVAGVRAGQRVLVHAAAGGVGHLAVQIAAAHGAHVVGTARAAKHDLLLALGAAEMIDYTAGPFEAAAHDFDIVLDPVSGDYGLRSLRVLAPGGVLLDVRGTGPDREPIRAEAARRDARFVQFGFSPSGADLARLGADVVAGAVRVRLAEVLPLADAATAHRIVEAGRVTGKVVLVR
jgi:NADPH:quinone reductase-like Zn-dependent oxidoreductase